MKIVYFINGFDPGGAEHGLLTLIEAGFFADHELKVLGICSGRGALHRRIQAALPAGATIIADPDERLTVKGCLRSAIALHRLLRDWKPDMVVLSLKQANVIGRSMLALHPRVICVSFEHIGGYAARHLDFLYGPLLWLLSWRVDRVWADCRETLEQTRRYFMASRGRRRESVIPLFCADNVARPSGGEEERSTANLLRLGAAGRLVARKRFDLLIDTVAALRSLGVTASLEICGEGPERRALEARARILGVAGSVSFSGYRRDWLSQMANVDAFLNLSENEGFCIVIAEAMAAGLLVVATDVGGVRDYGVDGENLLKVADPSPDTLAHLLIGLRADRRVEQIRRRASDSMRAQYSRLALRRCAQSVLTA